MYNYLKQAQYKVRSCKTKYDQNFEINYVSKMLNRKCFSATFASGTIMSSLLTF